MKKKVIRFHGGVYLLESPEGKMYIGRTRNLDLRLQQFKYSTPSGGNRFLKADILRLGFDKFKIIILERFSSDTPVERMDTRERFWISTLNTKFPEGYNLTRGGSRGYEVLPEGRKTSGGDSKKLYKGGVVAYDLNTGMCLGEFETSSSCAFSLNLHHGYLCNILKGKAKSYKGVTILKVSEDKGEAPTDILLSHLPIMAYSIKNEEIEEFKNKQAILYKQGHAYSQLNKYIDKRPSRKGIIYVRKTADWKEKIENLLKKFKESYTTC